MDKEKKKYEGKEGELKEKIERKIGYEREK